MRAPVSQGNIPRSRDRKRSAKQRLLLGPRPEAGLGEWLAAIVRGLDALEFLERSRELASEAVVASPVRVPTGGR
jgi:hypothetical protein